MYGEHLRYKVFTRRTAMLAGGKFALLSALVGRMYYLQILESDRYMMLADDNRINLRLLPPPRGRITDRFGTDLAVNRQNYRVVLVSEQTRDVRETLAALRRIIFLDDYEIRRILREVQRKRSFVPVTVRENLSWEEVARIEVNAPDLPGVSIDVGETRYYPQGEATAHLLGYVAAVSESELTGDPLLELPDFRIGKDGIEKVYDAALRGKAGTTQVEVNAYGRVIRELSRKEGQPGRELALTVDIGLQEFAIERFGEQSGAAVVLDVQTGGVLAMVSSPGFDPNAFAQGISAAYWRHLISDPRGPLTNKAVAGHYAPGSTFKMMVALAAMENGVLGPGHRVFCPGYVDLGDRRFHCWKKQGHGSMEMLPAIRESCDVYFYDVARRTGIDRISELAGRFGFGRKLGLDLPGEGRGLLPTREWKQAVIGVPWQQGETLIVGIGQGYLLATPLQMAVMTARLANGGVAVEPHLTRKPDAEKPQFESMGLSPNTLSIVLKGMKQVTNNPKGTAFRARIKEDGMEMAGKTGTAQVRRISRAERLSGIRKNEDLPWRERDHALFVGFAPVDAPRYAVAVVVEHGGGGSSVAAPIARDILIEAQRRNSARKPASERVADSPPVDEPAKRTEDAEA